MDNCCGGEVREEAFTEILKTVLKSKLINLEIFSISVGILIALVVFKNRARVRAGSSLNW